MMTGARFRTGAMCARAAGLGLGLALRFAGAGAATSEGRLFTGATAAIAGAVGMTAAAGTIFVSGFGSCDRVAAPTANAIPNAATTATIPIVNRQGMPRRRLATRPVRNSPSSTRLPAADPTPTSTPIRSTDAVADDDTLVGDACLGCVGPELGQRGQGWFFIRSGRDATD